MASFVLNPNFMIKWAKKHHLGYFWGYDHLPESAVNTFSADHAYMREKGLK